jgi:GTP pyrophosphokinase
LGDRLRGGNATDEDLRLLDSYRRSFGSAYEDVVRIIRDDLGLQPTGRPAKSTTSIIEKLRRESIRLSQMQDIAGCRVVMADAAAQNRVVMHLLLRFPQNTVIDRRERPSYGYRAAHVVVKAGEKRLEVQVRTLLQHLWAELSEKFSDVVDPSIKYGGGGEAARSALSQLSEAIAEVERVEQGLNLRSGILSAVGLGPASNSALGDDIAKAHETLTTVKRDLAAVVERIIALVGKVR